MTDEPHIIEEIHIEAEPNEVWDVLMDHDTLPEWSNGFLGTDKPMKIGEIYRLFLEPGDPPEN